MTLWTTRQVTYTTGLIAIREFVQSRSECKADFCQFHVLRLFFDNVSILSAALGADTTYSFGPRVESSRFGPQVESSKFYKPRKHRPTNFFSNRIGSSVSIDKSSLEMRKNKLRAKLDKLRGSPIGYVTVKPHLVSDGATVPELAASRGGNQETRVKLQTLNEIEPIEPVSSVDISNVYYRRRYPEYTTKVGFIPDK